MKVAELPEQVPEQDHSARVDAHQKVRGAARYTVDVSPSALAHLVTVRSPHAHARIRSIDTTEALKIDGVLAVITGHDVRDITWFGEDVPFLAVDTVRYVGDEVAAVIGTTLDAARDGAAAVRANYEPLPHVTEVTAALSDDAPRVHPDGNLAGEPEVEERGDARQAFELAAIVIEREFRTPIAVHNALEPHGAVADWDGQMVTVHTSTQGVNDVRELLAERLGLHHHQVRVVADHIGGGFGAKQVPWKPTALAVVASRHLGRPVSSMNDRRAENLAAGKRNASIQRVRLGADSDGRLHAIDADLIADVGAYSVAGEASNLAGPYLHLYACENVRTRSRHVYTNTGPAVAFRAPGYVEATFALESAMDELAAQLGIDPIELRRRNYATRDQQQDLPWSSPDALSISYDRVAEASAWATPVTAPDQHGVVRGRGFAAHEWMAGTAMPPAVVRAELNRDGTVHLSTSSQDIGTGTRTALLEVAASEFGVAPSEIRLTMGDTAAGPPAPTSSGSTTMPTVGPAIGAAMAELRRRVLARAAELLDADVDDLSFDGYRISGPGGDDGIGCTLAELLEQIAPDDIRSAGKHVSTTDEVSVRPFGSVVAEVDVDTWTGEVRVTRLVIAPDCGRIVDRTLADSQVIGGATQGIGFALTEEQVIDHEHGLVVNPELENYLVPTVRDVGEILHAAVDVADFGANPLGVKGLGELPMIAVPAAIANAVAAATGCRLTELPLTRRRVLDALAKRDTSREEIS